MTTNISDYLAEQKRLAEAATPGPWEYSPTVLGVTNTTILAPASGEHVSYVALANAVEKNAEFIAAARESVPKMIAALEAVMAVHHEGVVYADDVCTTEPLPDDFEEHFCHEDGELWPCKTIRAIEAALGASDEQ